MGANNSVPANYSTAAYALIGLDIVFTTAAVTGRTASRKLMKATPAIDDYLCYIAFIANLGLLVSGLLLTAFGAVDSNYASFQSDEDQHFVWATYNSLAILYIFAMASIKLSILFLYRRTFTMLETWFRWCWWILVNLVMLWTATCIILLALQAVGKMPENSFARLGISTTGIINAFSDILVLMLPVVMISRMKLQKKQKIALISIFGIGGIASIVSLIRGTMLFVNRDHQLNEAYSNYLEIVLTATESSTGLLCACLPLTKPVVIHFTRWIQKVRGLDTNHQGWSSISASAKNTDHDMKITRVVDYHVQLLPMSKFTNAQTSFQDREGMIVEKPWQSVGPYEAKAFCESVVPQAPYSSGPAKLESKSAWGTRKI